MKWLKKEEYIQASNMIRDSLGAHTERHACLIIKERLEKIPISYSEGHNASLLSKSKQLEIDHGEWMDGLFNF